MCSQVSGGRRGRLAACCPPLPARLLPACARPADSGSGSGAAPPAPAPPAPRAALVCASPLPPLTSRGGGGRARPLAPPLLLAPLLVNASFPAPLSLHRCSQGGGRRAAGAARPAPALPAGQVGGWAGRREGGLGWALAPPSPPLLLPTNQPTKPTRRCCSCTPHPAMQVWCGRRHRGRDSLRLLPAGELRQLALAWPSFAPKHLVLLPPPLLCRARTRRRSGPAGVRRSALLC